MNKYEKMYEDILLACRTGEVVIVKDDDNDFRAIRYSFNQNSPLSLGIWVNDIDEAKTENFIAQITATEFVKYATEADLQIVETYVPEYERVPVGTKVLITNENCSTAGSIGEVVKQTFTDYIIETGKPGIQCYFREDFTVILPEVEAVKFNNDIVVNCPPIKETPKTITLDGVEYNLTPKQND
jgi:hypothetical protein